MMELSDEEYERRDTWYAREREPLDARAKHDSFLEKVINGEATFENRALEFSRKFMQILETENISGVVKILFAPVIPPSGADRYMKELMSFIGAVEDICSSKVPIAEEAFNDYLTGRRKIKDNEWPGTNKVFEILWATAKTADRKIRRLYATTLFSKNPRLFRELYADMSPEERVYTEQRIYKMLGAGIFTGTGIDEIAVQRRLHDPVLQSQFDKYIDNVIGFVSRNQVKDPVSMRYNSPNESFMRTIEERLTPPVSEEEKADFRRSLFWEHLWEKDNNLDYTCHERLCQAIEKKIDDIPALRDRR